MPQPSPLTQVRERLLASASRLFRRPAPPAQKSSATGPLIAFDTHRRPVWTPRDYASLANEGFMQNAIVYRSVRMIAEAVASVPFLLYAGEDEIAEHPLLRLVSRPNPFQTGPELIEAFIGHLLVSGNAYLDAVGIDGEVRELHALRPDRMKVIPGADGWPEAWEYTVAGRSVRIHAEPVPGMRPILHLKQFHATNDHYGLSPLEAAASAIDLHNTASQWNKALLDNAARPSGALVYTARDGNMTAEQYERLKSELENGFQGSANAGRPLLLEGGLDWKSMSLSPKDMDFIEARHVAAREIALALGVPPMLLGIPGDNTYSNLAEANRIFWRSTVLPLANRLANALSHWLAPAYQGDSFRSPASALDDMHGGSRSVTVPNTLRLVPDLDSLEALASEREALRASLEKTSFLTTEEKRAAIGYGPMSPPEPSAAKFNPYHDALGRFTSGPGGEGADDDSDDNEDPLLHLVGGLGGRRTRRGGQSERGNPRARPGHNNPPGPVPPIIPPPGRELPDEAQRSIDAYREQHNMPTGEGTVAHAVVDGQTVFGVNSLGPGYTADDRQDANALRELLVNKYPSIMRSDNPGQMPNDALYHAETTLLLRTARDAGGDLSGRTIEMRVDRGMCESCKIVLPYVSRELGNPTIIFRGPKEVLTLSRGSWSK